MPREGRARRQCALVFSPVGRFALCEKAEEGIYYGWVCEAMASGYRISRVGDALVSVALSHQGTGVERRRARGLERAACDFER